MRDPKIDPAAGDVLCSAKSTALIIVTAADGAFVSYTIRAEGCVDAARRDPIDEWRRLAARTDMVSLVDKIASLEAERAAAIVAHEKRLRSLDASLAFLRGQQ